MQFRDAICRETCFKTLLAVLLFGCLVHQSFAQNHCKVRYTYNASGDRVQRDWHCWEPGGGDPGENKALALAEVRVGVRPNPASDELFVTLPEGTSSGSLALVNAMGGIVISQAVRGALNVLDVRGLAKGSYFLRYQQGGESIVTPIMIE